LRVRAAWREGERLRAPFCERCTGAFSSRNFRAALYSLGGALGWIVGVSRIFSTFWFSQSMTEARAGTGAKALPARIRARIGREWTMRKARDLRVFHRQDSFGG
jgi:hypothetical protein